MEAINLCNQLNDSLDRLTDENEDETLNNEIKDIFRRISQSTLVDIYQLIKENFKMENLNKILIFLMNIINERLKCHELKDEQLLQTEIVVKLYTIFFDLFLISNSHVVDQKLRSRLDEFQERLALYDCHYDECSLAHQLLEIMLEGETVDDECMINQKKSKDSYIIKLIQL
ncbi:hypothetical protein SNEBB_008360 [Seison nebaliae]|nr:hypothetical protein SNEBB_008360 [Seison nebaliae]